MPELISLMIIPAAFALDLLAGDPPRLPHPVRWMGWAIEKFEPVCRSIWRQEVIAGAVFAVLLIGTSWVLTFITLKVMLWLHPMAGVILEIILLYYCLSARSLIQAAMEIHQLLDNNQVDSARNKLSFIVGRDVTRYHARDISRATVETVAENLVDGVLSPLFYATLGGAPLAVAYKMINTLDSMVGYKDQRYLRFGKIAARIDDAANFIPARLAVPLIALAAQLLSGRHGRRSWRTAIKEGAQHASPNAGYPEAAFAGALAVKMNGPNMYHGQWVKKPYIGTVFGQTSPKHIIKACHLLLMVALLGCLASTLLAITLY